MENRCICKKNVPAILDKNRPKAELFLESAESGRYNDGEKQ